MGVTRIQDYGLIGDGRSAALVSRLGAIDWLCWPRFDSPSLFAAVLDADKGGTWRIAPSDPFRASRAYARESNVLVTTFDCAGGRARLTDLMPVYSEAEKQLLPVPEHEILRVVECLEGEVELEVHFQPRPDYARKVVPLRWTHAFGVRLEHGLHLYTLRSDAPLHDGAEHTLTTRFRLRAGERRYFSLTYDTEAPAVFPPVGHHAEARVRRTHEWWRAWAGRCRYDGPYREEVVRSLLTLKLLSFAPSGAIVAAPTTSLPERVGGDLNWDYRYCWVRDASLTIRALFDVGYQDEAEAFVSWLLHSTRLTRPQLSVLYDVYGGLPRNEEILAHLDGHLGSRPVRIRNAAAKQLQLDAYGEVIDGVFQMCRPGVKLDRETQQMLRQLGHFVCENWRRPDQGIWEPRQPGQHHTHSRMTCWVALDRLLQLQDSGALTRGPRDKFDENRRLIREDIERHAWNPSMASYTQVLGGDTVDASLLLLSWYGFAPASDYRMRATFARIQERLQAAPGLYYRYEESRTVGEGAFGICSFWAAEFLARGGGSLSDAQEAFQQVLSYGNDLGLFAEEMDPRSGEHLGNFPQAFTHVGLISAALALEERRSRMEEAEADTDQPRFVEPQPAVFS